MQEIWKSVVGYEGYYEVSNKGSIKSVQRNILNKGNSKNNASIFRIKERILKIRLNEFGYYTVSVSKKSKIQVFLVHRLVAQSFISNPLTKPFVNHIDNNPKNNNSCNLEWCTQKENIHHAISQGRNVFGEKSNMAKLKEKDILDIRGNYIKKSGEIKKLTIKYSVTRRTIADILKRKTWKHI